MGPFEDVFPIKNGDFPLTCWIGSDLLPKKSGVWNLQLGFRSSNFSHKIHGVILLMAEILHHLGCMKPKKWDKLPINWCRISAINSKSYKGQKVEKLIAILKRLVRCKPRSGVPPPFYQQKTPDLTICKRMPGSEKSLDSWKVFVAKLLSWIWPNFWVGYVLHIIRSCWS